MSGKVSVVIASIFDAIAFKNKTAIFFSPLRSVGGGPDPPLNPFWLHMTFFVVKSQQSNGLVQGDGCVDFYQR